MWTLKMRVLLIGFDVCLTMLSCNLLRLTKAYEKWFSIWCMSNKNSNWTLINKQSSKLWKKKLYSVPVTGIALCFLFKGLDMASTEQPYGCYGTASNKLSCAKYKISLLTIGILWPRILCHLFNMTLKLWSRMTSFALFSFTYKN